MMVLVPSGFIVGVLGLLRPGSRKKAITGIVLCIGAPFLLVLLQVAAPQKGRVHKARIAATETRVASLKRQIDAFAKDNGRLPNVAEGLEALMTCPAGLEATWHGPYGTRDLFEDSWAQRIVYRIPGIDNPGNFDLFSVGEDGVPNSGDDLKRP